MVYGSASCCEIRTGITYADSEQRMVDQFHRVLMKLSSSSFPGIFPDGLPIEITGKPQLFSIMLIALGGKPAAGVCSEYMGKRLCPSSAKNADIDKIRLGGSVSLPLVRLAKSETIDADTLTLDLRRCRGPSFELTSLDAGLDFLLRTSSSLDCTSSNLFSSDFSIASASDNRFSLSATEYAFVCCSCCILVSNTLLSCSSPWNCFMLVVELGSSRKDWS
mmetsp:Transcript_14351/g.24660  ORF Transcript_14351/g.24660 Transcript_14351/m.24660 type:complete len:220 (-) Transcript_14351:1053-1712(-)